MLIVIELLNITLSYTINKKREKEIFENVHMLLQ